MVLADTGYRLAMANSRGRWRGAAVAATRRLDEVLSMTWLSASSGRFGRQR